MPLGKNTDAFFKFLMRNPPVIPPLGSVDNAIYRKAVYAFFDAYADKEIIPGISIEEIIIFNSKNYPLKLTIYRPTGNETKPAVIYYPGGGFTVDFDNLYNTPCSRMGSISNCVIIKVSCRLAPEFKHPNLFADAYYAAQYISQHAKRFNIDPSRLAVAGNSSGGNLAALVANKSKDDNSLPIAHQFLLSPRVDITFTSGGCNDFQEYEEQDLMLTKAASKFASMFYLPEGADPKNSSISPFYADLSNTPPATVYFGEYDALRGDGEAYVKKLIAANISVTKIIEPHVHNTLLCWPVLSDGHNPAELIGKMMSEKLNHSVC